MCVSLNYNNFLAILIMNTRTHFLGFYIVLFLLHSLETIFITILIYKKIPKMLEMNIVCWIETTVQTF